MMELSHLVIMELVPFGDVGVVLFGDIGVVSFGDIGGVTFGDIDVDSFDNIGIFTTMPSKLVPASFYLQLSVSTWHSCYNANITK